MTLKSKLSSQSLIELKRFGTTHARAMMHVKLQKFQQQGLHCIRVTGAHVVASTNLQIKSRVVEVFAITLRRAEGRKG